MTPDSACRSIDTLCKLPPTADTQTRIACIADCHGRIYVSQPPDNGEAFTVAGGTVRRSGRFWAAAPPVRGDVGGGPGLVLGYRFRVLWGVFDVCVAPCLAAAQGIAYGGRGDGASERAVLGCCAAGTW